MPVAQLFTVCAPASSLTVWFAPLVNDGASLTAFTVNIKVFTSGPPTDRLTVTVILVVPFAFVAGLIVTTPVEPVITALKCAGSLGIKAVLLDDAVTEVIVLVSPASKGTTAWVASSNVLVSAMLASATCAS